MNPATMKPTVDLSPAEAFFWTHADWFYAKGQRPAVGRTKGALVLANAEQSFQRAETEAGFSFHVAPASAAEDDAPVFSMWLENAEGECVAWLEGIEDDAPARRRLVRAELALDATETLRSAMYAQAC